MNSRKPSLSFLQLHILYRKYASLQLVRLTEYLDCHDMSEERNNRAGSSMVSHLSIQS
jgi:hypothetical protein